MSKVTINGLGILLSRFWTSPFTVSDTNCCFLICIQVSQEAGKVVWYSHPFKNFPQFVVIYTVKVFRVVNEADAFLECFLYRLTDVVNLISGSSAFSKSNLTIWKFLVHVLWKPSLKNFSISLLVCEMSTFVQEFEHSLELPFSGNGAKTDLFQPYSHCWVFQICWHIECNT